ncbi:hypothetical protein L3X38_031845 [Prunus dulcis]|uniref:Uncharacterized protein n=1 Tax=Prunus dulcis TaxID=3755 RepID=A0AAD4VDB1_PRUDU|nr:hypothetical protein L3X38_031845 [Prunus dulcis]
MWKRRPQSKRMWKTAQNGNVGQNQVQATNNGNACQNDIAPTQTNAAPAQTNTAPAQTYAAQLKLTLPPPKFKLIRAEEQAKAEEEEEEEAYGIQLQGCHLHNQLVAYYSCPT